MARIERAPGRRVHVTDARDWSQSIGTDYWAKFGVGSTTAATALSNFGWITTSLVETAATGGGDFLSSSDIGVPDHILTNASGDLIQSPSMLGGWDGAAAAGDILGYDPTTLSVEFLGAMTVFTGTSTQSGWGLIEDGGSVATAADHLAFIYTDGTNFTLRSDADSDAGAADDAAWHLWKIVIKTGSATDAVEWFIDGTSQGTMDRKTDEWPASFGMHALTTNRPALAWVHAWYA